MGLRLTSSPSNRTPASQINDAAVSSVSWPPPSRVAYTVMSSKVEAIRGLAVRTMGLRVSLVGLRGLVALWLDGSSTRGLRASATVVPRLGGTAALRLRGSSACWLHGLCGSVALLLCSFVALRLCGLEAPCRGSFLLADAVLFRTASLRCCAVFASCISLERSSPHVHIARGAFLQ